MRSLTFFTITIGWVIVIVSSERQDGDNVYTLEELQDYLSVIEKKMNIELKFALKKLQRQVLWKTAKSIDSLVKDKMTGLLKDGTMKSYFDKTLLDHMNRIQDDLRVVKVKVMDNTGSLKALESRQAVLEADLVKDAQNASDEVRNLGKDLKILETGLNTVIFSKMERMNKDMLALRLDTTASVRELGNKLDEVIHETNRSVVNNEMSVRELEKKLGEVTAQRSRESSINAVSIRELEKKFDEETEERRRDGAQLQDLKTAKSHLLFIKKNYFEDINALRIKHNLPLRCDEPKWLPDSPMSYHCRDYTEGSSCLFTCFYARQTEYIVCKVKDLTPQWVMANNASQAPTCQAKKCPSLRPPNFGALACVKNLACIAMCAKFYGFDERVSFTEVVFCGKSNRWSTTTIPDCHWLEYGEARRLPENYNYETEDDIRENFRRLTAAHKMLLDSDILNHHVEVLYGDQPEDYYDW